MAFLSSNHAIQLLLDYHYLNNSNPHCFFLNKLISKQRLKVKSSIINANNCLNGIFPSFNPLYKELISGFCLVDTIPNCFSVNTVDYKIKNFKIAYLQKLGNIFENFLQNTKAVIIISNTVTNFIQLVSPQLVDLFLQPKLH